MGHLQAGLLGIGVAEGPLAGLFGGGDGRSPHRVEPRGILFSHARGRHDLGHVLASLLGRRTGDDLHLANLVVQLDEVIGRFLGIFLGVVQAFGEALPEGHSRTDPRRGIADPHERCVQVQALAGPFPERAQGVVAVGPSTLID